MPNKNSSLMAGLAGSLLAASLILPAHAADPAQLTLLHVNDVYQLSPSGGHGGLAELMTLLEAERGRADNVITTFGGDLLSPSVMSGLTKGMQMVDLFNAIGVDVAVFGNHEFDFGNEVLEQRIGESQFPWLATNVAGNDGNPFGGGQALWTQTAGDFTVGFFGLLTPETETLSSTGTGVNFTPFIESATAAVAALEEQGADVVIALTHLEIAQDRELAASVDGIDLILGGHDHDPITFYENGVLIQKSGTDAQFLGVVDLLIEEVEGRDGPRTVVRPEWRMVSTRGVDPHPDIAPMVATYEARLDEELNVEIGTTEVALESVRGSVRTKETTMGNLIADAVRADANADIGLANGGGIRGDTVYEAGTVLTRKDILTELPFGNTAVLLRLSGADVLAALENGVSRVEDINGRFPQVSGLSFVYDPSSEAGARVESVTVGGAPLDLDKMYTVATNNFIAGGGDGYSMLGNGEVLVDGSAGTLLATVVMDYVAAQGRVAPAVEGRIVNR